MPDGTTEVRRPAAHDVHGPQAAGVDPDAARPNFFRSVVFMIEHTDEGALGLVLNQPTDARRRDGARLGHGRRRARRRVRRRSGAAARSGDRPGPGRAGSGLGDAWQPLLGRIGTVDLGRDPPTARRPRGGADLRRLLGVGAGGSRARSRAGGWFVVDARPDDLLTADPAGLWRAVLRRQGGDLAVSANYPLGGPAAN